MPLDGLHFHTRFTAMSLQFQYSSYTGLHFSFFFFFFLGGGGGVLGNITYVQWGFKNGKIHGQMIQL